MNKALPYIVEYMKKIVHPRGGDLPGVQGDEGELVHLQAGHHAQGPEEGVADAVLAEGTQLLDLPVEELQADVGDTGVGNVNGAQGGTDRLENMFNLIRRVMF